MGCERSVCLSYACANTAVFTGTVTVSSEAEALDLELCRGSDSCRSATLQLAEVRQLDRGGGRCSGAGPETVRLCASRAGDDEHVYELQASWNFGGDADMLSKSDQFELRVDEEPSGTRLAEAIKTVDYHVKREDECHLCWGGAQTF
jgi:hypothetical protein